MQARSLDGVDPLEDCIATHSSILAWRIPWTEEPGRLQSIVLQRVWQEWNNLACSHEVFTQINFDQGVKFTLVTSDYTLYHSMACWMNVGLRSSCIHLQKSVHLSGVTSRRLSMQASQGQIWGTCLLEYARGELSLLSIKEWDQGKRNSSRHMRPQCSVCWWSTKCVLVTRLLCLWNSPCKNTGVNCHFLL